MVQMPDGTKFYATINGQRFFTSNYLTEIEEYDEEMERTFFMRWIEPILHPATVPFEPWRKTVRVSGVRQVPAKNGFITPLGVVVHPSMMSRIRDCQFGNAML